jgi:hypothetical protein
LWVYDYFVGDFGSVVATWSGIKGIMKAESHETEHFLSLGVPQKLQKLHSKQSNSKVLNYKFESGKHKFFFNQAAKITKTA